MKNKAKFIPIIVVLTLLMSLVAIIPTFASSRGTVAILDASDTTKALTWARQGGTMVIQVIDSDLNTATTVTSETLTFTACAAAGDQRTVQTASQPIVDKDGSGTVNFADVTISSDGDAGTSIFSADGPNGVVVLLCTAAGAAANTTSQEVDYKAAGVQTIGDTTSSSIVKVISGADSTGIGVVLTETGNTSGKFRATVNLTAADSVAGTKSLKVGASDVVTLKYIDSAPTPATTVTDSVTVETTGASFTNFSPAHNSGTQGSRPIVNADVTDAESGVTKTTIQIVWAMDTDMDGDIESTGVSIVNDDGTVVAIDAGFRIEQRLPAANVPSTDTLVNWWVVATDAAGNVQVSDQKTTNSDGTSNTCDATEFPATKTGQTHANLVGADVTDADITVAANDVALCQPFTIRIDFTSPDMTASKTGQWWDTTIAGSDKTNTTASKAKDSSIKVTFNENLDAATVQASDFTVDGITPSAAVVYSGVKSAVFLTVSALAPDAKPVVKLVSQVKDIAGNAVSVDSVNSSDGIAPTITVTVTGTASGTIPVTKDTVTIQISTNESSSIDGDSIMVRPVATKTSLGDAQNEGTTQYVTTQTWKVTFTPTLNGVFNVYVTAKDMSNNTGSTGAETDPSSTSAILFEVDNRIPSPSYTPSAAASTDNPDAFIIIDFTAEGVEYGLKANNAFTTVAGEVVTDKDTHGKVTLTAVTLDGKDILSAINTEDNVKFLYKASGLSIGSHTIKVSGTDEAGNKIALDKEIFKVTAKVLFSVKLQPGWNLVSLPNSPADPAINSVISSTLPIDTVLTYDPNAQGGPWLTAVRDTASGNLVGSLTQITAGRAYWVHTTTFQPIKVNIPGTAGGQQATLPTVSLNVGWNLVPAVDVSGTKAAGDALDTTAAQYLAGVKFSRIYEYTTLSGQFSVVLSTTSLKVGKGYWVYVTEAAVLVP